MSDKVQYSRAAALSLAVKIQEKLRPLCQPDRCEIVGSIRREKPTVGDIEILYVPIIRKVRVDMFHENDADAADDQLNDWLRQGIFAKRLNVRGHETWGPKNKHALHVKSKIPVDLFATTEENWWVSLVIRTGSKDTNLRLTTGANAQNARLNAYGCGVTFSDSSIVRATSERHVFELCNVPYLEPNQR